METKIIKYKHIDLIYYGLNPMHWFVSEWSKNNPKSAQLTHIDDPELKLEARLKRKNKDSDYRIAELSFAY
jgi:hypothetical protein